MTPWCEASQVYVIPVYVNPVLTFANCQEAVSLIYELSCHQQPQYICREPRISPCVIFVLTTS